MWGHIRRSRGCGLCSAQADWRWPVAAELLAGHEVDHGVLTGEEPAERRLAGCRLEAAEGPGHAGISVRADSELLVVTVEGAENGCRGLADGRMGAGVGRVGRGDRERV